MATEYISREAAQQIVHDRAMEMALNNVGFRADASDILEHISKRAQDWISEIPAADVRPVVLCRDCKHFNSYPGDCTDGGIEGVCKRHNSIGVLVMDEDFCSDAERI